MKMIMIAILLGASSQVTAADPDFYINFSSCKSMVGYLVLSEESLKVLPSDPGVMACTKAAENIKCDFKFLDGQDVHKGNSEDYKVVIDSPPYLHFKTDTGAEYVAVDTSQRAAALITRIVEDKFAGAKVCQGIYATSFEIFLLGNGPE